MPRSARIVLPGMPHHVTQRGNRRQPLFYSDEDRLAYRELVALYCRKHTTQCLAWCLMDNHVHLILKPATADGLRATLAGAHTTYAQRINRLQQSYGHLFQGRYYSYPMNETHLWIAARYVELNPVRAGLVERAEDWHWSSARAHVSRLDDGLTDIAGLGDHVANWSAMLAQGLEAADEADDHIDKYLARGLPLGSPEWRATVAAEQGISLEARKRGPKGPHRRTII